MSNKHEGPPMTAPSDTPRTDAAVVSREFIAREMDSYAFKFVLADFARTLERQLSAVKMRREEWERLNPTGGAAAMLEAMAKRVRAGEPFHEVLEDFNMASLEKVSEARAEAEGLTREFQSLLDALAIELLKEGLFESAERGKRAAKGRD